MQRPEPRRCTAGGSAGGGGGAGGGRGLLLGAGRGDSRRAARHEAARTGVDGGDAIGDTGVNGRARP